MKVSNTDEVRAAIAAIDKKFMEDANRGDAAAGAAAYTDDAILMPPNHSPLVRENRRLRSTWPR